MTVAGWLLIEDEDIPGRWLLFRERGKRWQFVRYLRALTY